MANSTPSPLTTSIQLELPLERPGIPVWHRAARWFFDCGNDSALESWQELPGHRQEFILGAYHLHRHQPATLVFSLYEHAADAAETLAGRWATEITQAFLDGQPCPILAVPQTEHILRRALQIAQIPVNCLKAAESAILPPNPRKSARSTKAGKASFRPIKASSHHDSVERPKTQAASAGMQRCHAFRAFRP